MAVNKGIMKCLNCQKEFENKRKSAKFCSPRCRVYFNRKDSVTVSVAKEEVSVTKEEEPVTLKKQRQPLWTICKKCKIFYANCKCP